jgi:hypothetical protein
MKKLLAICLLAGTTLYAGSEINGPSHNGVEVSVDLPPEQHVRNIGAPKDGKGLCVFASIDMAARWHHMPELIDLLHKIPDGGGWPEKVDEVMKRLAPDRKYVQYEGADPAILDSAVAIRAPACVTYGTGERYQNQTIYHMVLLVHLDAKSACIIDNNFPGTYEWMTRDEFLSRWKHPSGQGWAIVFLEAPPPPSPRSLGQ